MPTEMTIDYIFTGNVTQDIYTEEEMADALDMTVDDLRRALDEDLYGPCSLLKDRPPLSFHAHPRVTGQGFLFNRAAYQNNLRRYNIVQWLRSIGK